MLTICDRLAEERERVREIDPERALVMECFRERVYLATVGMLNATTQVADDTHTHTHTRTHTHTHAHRRTHTHK
jgi:hypothetical protein